MALGCVASLPQAMERCAPTERAVPLRNICLCRIASVPVTKPKPSYGREQRAESREQRAESREQRADVRLWRRRALLRHPCLRRSGGAVWQRRRGRSAELPRSAPPAASGRRADAVRAYGADGADIESRQRRHREWTESGRRERTESGHRADAERTHLHPRNGGVALQREVGPLTAAGVRQAPSGVHLQGGARPHHIRSDRPLSDFHLQGSARAHTRRRPHHNGSDRPASETI